MQNILRSIELKKELDALRPLEKAQEERIMQKFRLDWNYHSNHLEGNSLTFGETKNLILHGITAQGKPLKDHFEITGHNEAINMVLEVIKGERPLTETFVREIHLLLLKESYYVDAITPDGSPTKKLVKVGEYKTSPNHVKTSTGEIFRFAEPEETPALMTDLLDWYKAKSAESDVNPILLASEFHYKFIRIHPFDDGNGRTVRILMNFILMHFGYPPVVIKTEDKNNYFFALRQADNGDFEFFAEYIGQNMLRSLELMIAGAKGESIEEPDDLDKNIALLEHRLKGIGEKTEIFRSNKAIGDIFGLSLFNLVIAFIDLNEKFKKFYDKTSFTLLINNDLNYLKNSLEIRDEIRVSTQRYVEIESIVLLLNYQSFIYTNISEFDYTSKLEFKFTKIKYEVICNELSYKKNYNEHLSAEEMTKLVATSMKEHTNFIDNQIKEFESKNKDSK